MVLGSGDVQFDPSKLKMVTPGLSEARGYRLSQHELEEIFGIDGGRFGALPGRLVVPVLEGQQKPVCNITTGHLFLVEPMAWIPQVVHGEAIPVSKFKTEHTTEIKKVNKTAFNAATSASLDIKGGGSYYGVTAKVKSSSTIDFKVSTSSTVTESTKTAGTTGDVPVHELMVYPILECKVIKKQHLESAISTAPIGVPPFIILQPPKLTWGHDDADFWEKRRVEDFRLDGVKKLSYNPVPMTGNTDCANLAYLLPVPQITSNGEVEVTTLLSCEGWKDWLL